MKTLKIALTTTALIATSAFAAPTELTVAEELKAYATTSINTTIAADMAELNKVDTNEIKVAVLTEAKAIDFKPVYVAVEIENDEQAAE